MRRVCGGEAKTSLMENFTVSRTNPIVKVFDTRLVLVLPFTVTVDREDEEEERDEKQGLHFMFASHHFPFEKKMSHSTESKIPEEWLPPSAKAIEYLQKSYKDLLKAYCANVPFADHTCETMTSNCPWGVFATAAATPDPAAKKTEEKTEVAAKSSQ